MADELLLCPWCAEKPELNKHFREEVWSLLHRCKIMGPIKLEWGDRDDHIARWNTRSPITSPQT